MKYGYDATIHSHCLDSEYSDEPYGPWHESWSNNFGYIRKTSSVSDVSSDLDIQPGEKVFVVWVEYSTGDSFGWASRRGTEVAGLFRDFDAANAFSDWLRNNQKEYSISYQALDGQKIDTYAPWSGYFETLEDVHVESTTLNF